MKRLHYILLAVTFIFCVQTQGFAKTSSDKDIEVCFGEIRADLFRYVCDMLNVKDTALTNKIETISLDDFKKAVEENQFPAYQQLKNYLSYSQLIDAKKSLPDNYKGLYASIDYVCNSLKTSFVDQSKAIEDKRIEFHKRLAASAIEYNAYQIIIQVAESDTVFVKEQFRKLFCQNGTTNNEDKKSLVEHFKQFLAKNLKYLILFVLIFTLFFVYYWFVIRHNNKKNNDSHKTRLGEQNINNNQQVPQNLQDGMSENTTLNEVASNTQRIREDEIVTPITPQKTEEKKDRCFFYDDNSVSIVGASVIGNSHVSMKLPCQDCCGYESLGRGWGIAVTSDGAGSAEHSEIGSGIVVSRAIEHFKHYLTAKNWLVQNYVPTDAEWTQVTYNIIKAIYNEMKDFSEKKSFEFKSLNATIIVIIHTPYGLLTCHVGDGRAGYRNASGDWKSVITPHKGEEANQTIFVTSGFWSIPNYVMSGVMVPECRVIKDKITAFTLMSDGCEATSWLYNQQNENGKFYDPNLPFPKFFNPLIESLEKMHEANTPYDERLSSWRDFLMTGGKFANEPDDKTMILGLILQ